MCETLWQKKMKPAELFECISQCILNAVDRDCLAGWGARVYLITEVRCGGYSQPGMRAFVSIAGAHPSIAQWVDEVRKLSRHGKFQSLHSGEEVDAANCISCPFFHLCLSGERQPLIDKNKSDPGNLGKSLDPVYQSVNPWILANKLNCELGIPMKLKKTIYCRLHELPEHTLEIFLLRTFEQYGPIKDVTMMPQRGQALIEFADISSAESAVVRCSEIPLTIANHRVRVNYSTSKRIVQRQLGGESGRDYSDGPLESRVLLFTIYNAQYPITVDVIHQITSRHGRVLRIVIFRKTHVQAMVEFKNTDDARNAKRNLNGADIYSGCCTLKIEFARPARLTVLKNDQETWDYENSLLPTDPGRIRISDGRANVSLLGRFGRSHDRHEGGSRSQNGDAGGYSFHDSFARHSGALSLGAPGSTLFDQLALSVHPSLAAAAAAETVLHGRSATPVVMVYNMDMDKMNCDRLFNLLCLYGNVIRVKFLRSKEGSAMAQMGDTLSVDRVIRNLSDVPLLGNQLQEECLLTSPL
ncbi:hypothetical protein T265_09986 [Opisthorchis viverrini]|uniref:RRM domain-containing protein n=1 Tax=Opisthorchis viverrini TaxID=6198 RepID=A0A074Z868_OPIVI|nr:hypothetical protein T265_09986 [Opisthorchis viverrini]KER21747.1 hypothetical protein T265_09986 [Opisthorchis viverrini]